MDGAAEVLLIDTRRPRTPSAPAARGNLAHGSDPAVDVFGREAVVRGGVAVVRLDRRIQGIGRGRGVLRGRRGGRAADGGDGLVGGTVAVVSRVLKNKCGVARRIECGRFLVQVPTWSWQNEEGDALDAAAAVAAVGDTVAVCAVGGLGLGDAVMLPPPLLLLLTLTASAACFLM